MDEAKERIEYLSIRVQTLRELIEELWSCKPYDEQQSLRILDLCNELLAEIHIIC
jgi:DNA-directed RNA polymerase subunit F